MIKNTDTRRRLLLIISAVVVFMTGVLIPVGVCAEEVTDYDFGYSLDLPEGFYVAEYTPDGMSYRFCHDRLPVNLILKLYAEGQYGDGTSALEGTLHKLSAEYEIDTFSWRNVPCSVSSFSMEIPGSGVKSSGWGAGVALPENGAVLALVCYADFEAAESCRQFIISTLNSLCIDRTSRYSPGIFTTYAFPPAGSRKILLNIAGKEIETEIDMEDVAASEFVVDCEYAVLSLYAGNKKWKEAWCRYYKAIFRDSYGRLKKPAFDINSALYSYARKINSSNPQAAMNELLLNWVQNFKYERHTEDRTGSDFENLPSVLCGKGSDCDSRSMLMSVLLGNMGVKSIMFVSREYSHAVYGAALDIPGAKIAEGGTEYLLGETTQKGIKPGLIAADMNDTEKWIPVDFYTVQN